MNITSFSVPAAGGVVQLLDGFVGKFRATINSNAEYSVDGSTWFNLNGPWGEPYGMHVSSPTSLYVKNVHGVNVGTAVLITWY